MYESFYGFREKPFTLLPDPEFLYLSAKHSSAYSVLDYGFTGQAGFTVISGEVGSGKTTLVRSFLRQVGDDTTVGLISNTSRGFGNLLQWILYAFELDYQGKDSVELHETFTKFLIAQYAAGRRCVLIIDEAQNLQPETLEELRMLSNVNASKDLLLQVILVGQPELAETLYRPDMRQFAQRIAISYHLKALTLQETHAYIRHRLTVAGGDVNTFTDAACDALYFLSKGIPRLINGLCDIALVYGYGEEMRQIDVDTVIAVVEDRSQSGQWMGDDPPSREQIHEEVRRLVATRRTKLASRSKRVVGQQGGDDGAPFSVVPSEAVSKTGPRVVSAFPQKSNGPDSQADSDNADVAPISESTGSESAGRTAAKEPALESDSSPEPSPAVPTARPGPREFSPEFHGSRRQPAPESTVYQGKLRWVLAAASVAIFALGLWLVLATPRFDQWQQWLN
jgi:type II secretory pathway predicted ATPase ExeA